MYVSGFPASDATWPALKQNAMSVVKTPPLSTSDWKDSNTEGGFKTAPISSQPLPSSAVGPTEKLVSFYFFPFLVDILKAILAELQCVLKTMCTNLCSLFEAGLHCGQFAFYTETLLSLVAIYRHSLQYNFCDFSFGLLFNPRL